MALEKILIVGFGTMAGAMVEGWLAAGYPAACFEVYHPSKTEAAHGLKVHNMWPTGHFDAILLGVKPHMLARVAAGLEPVAGPETIVISVLAGIELSSLYGCFPQAAGVVRLMPNLASALGKSSNALIDSSLSKEKRAEVTQLAADIGTAEWLADEGQFNLVTALVGSGPGFVYRFIDGLAAAAEDLGLAEDQAQRMALTMVEGAAALAASSKYSPGELARRVASPGGMTQMGLDVLDADDSLKNLLSECLRAARDRGAELARNQ